MSENAERPTPLKLEKRAYNSISIRSILMVTMFILFFVSYIDRVNVAVLVADPSFTDVFGITGNNSARGFITSAFLLSYGIGCIFMGPLIQRIGARKTLSIALICWAIIMFIMGSISSFTLLIACRLLLGITEAVVTPSVSKLIKEWFPPNERSKANASWFNGLVLAQCVSMPLVAALIGSFGWRASLFMLGALSIPPLILVIIFFYDKLSDNPRISSKELAHIMEGRKEEIQKEAQSIGDNEKATYTFLKKGSFWALVIMQSATNAGAWGIGGWLPILLKESFGFSWASMGILSSLPYICAFLAILIFSPVIDKLNKRSHFALWAMIAFATGMIISVLVPHPTVVVAGVCLALAGTGLTSMNQTNIMQNIMPANEVSTAVGCYLGISFIFAAIFPYAMGMVYDQTGSLLSGFYLLIIMAIIGSFAGIPLVKKKL